MLVRFTSSQGSMMDGLSSENELAEARAHFEAAEARLNEVVREHRRREAARRSKQRKGEQPPTPSFKFW